MRPAALQLLSSLPGPVFCRFDVLFFAAAHFPWPRAVFLFAFLLPLAHAADSFWSGGLLSWRIASAGSLLSPAQTASSPFHSCRVHYFHLAFSIRDARICLVQFRVRILF